MTVPKRGDYVLLPKGYKDPEGRKIGKVEHIWRNSFAEVDIGIKYAFLKTFKTRKLKVITPESHPEHFI